VRSEELENEAAHNRHIAARARRLAGSLSPGSERQGLERYAKELEHHAAELEAQARTSSPSPPALPYLLGSNSKANSDRPPKKTKWRGVRGGTEIRPTGLRPTSGSTTPQAAGNSPFPRPTRRR
jgi:hypothetical protein